MKTCFIIGRKAEVIDNIRNELSVPGVRIIGGTSLEELQLANDNFDISKVILGAGLDLNVRLEIIRYIFENSSTISVHMKDWDSGPGGMLPFVKSCLTHEIG